MKQHPSRSREAAEILAIQALAFIAEEPERLTGLLDATGLAVERIREAASEPDFLAGVLEHMLADESLLIAFAESAGIDPAGIARARNALGGIIGSERFAGGPTPDGKGWVPNITPAGLGHWGEDKIAWSVKDIASFLNDGMVPSGDYAGGDMAEVIGNTSLLSQEDRDAMAVYIVSLPPRQGPSPPPKKN